MKVWLAVLRALVAQCLLWQRPLLASAEVLLRRSRRAEPDVVTTALQFDEDSLNSNIKSLMNEITTTFDRVDHLKALLTRTHESLHKIGETVTLAEDKMAKDKKTMKALWNSTGEPDIRRLAAVDKLATELKPRLGVAPGPSGEADGTILTTLERMDNMLKTNVSLMRKHTFERLEKLEDVLRADPKILATRYIGRRLVKEMRQAPVKLADELAEETQGFGTSK
mmetsp:Transcript_34174/g.97079  ORF Transcript_34174/g.97079 Transcript_34174/m.97079 type:complete len:224 (-) Transcript_34174:156-827(-)